MSYSYQTNYFGLLLGWLLIVLQDNRNCHTVLDYFHEFIEYLLSGLL